MKSPNTQPNMTQKDPLATHRELQHKSQRALQIRTSLQTNWQAEEIRNYVSTIERDMDYKQSNVPWRNNHAHG